MLRDIGIIMLCAGVILLAISLILIFVLKIPELLDELSGRKAKRQIKRLKELNVGTGSLEGMATDDVYMAISSGSLVAEEIKIKQESQEELLDEDAATGDVQNESLEKPGVASGSIVSSSEEDDTPVAKVIEISDVDETSKGEEDPTGYMDEDEGVTSYVGDGDVTGMLNDVQEYVSNKKIIEIVEEQTSLI